MPRPSTSDLLLRGAAKVFVFYAPLPPRPVYKPFNPARVMRDAWTVTMSHFSAAVYQVCGEIERGQPQPTKRTPVSARA